MIWRSGSQILSMTFASANSGYLSSTGPKEPVTSRTAWWNSGSPGFLEITSSQMFSMFVLVFVMPLLLFFLNESSVLKQLATEEVAGVFETLEIAPFASFPPHKDYMPMSPVAKLLFRVVPYQEQVLSGRVSLQDRPLKG